MTPRSFVPSYSRSLSRCPREASSQPASQPVGHIHIESVSQSVSPGTTEHYKTRPEPSKAGRDRSADGGNGFLRAAANHEGAN